MSKINLMFHDVKLNPSKWNTRPSQFENLMNQIVMHANRDDIQITVDDAGKGNYQYMLPVFEKLGLKAIILVPTQFIASENSTTSTYMNVRQIREFSDLGHTIGSHSHSHPKNISLLPMGEIKKEWEKSKKILEEIIGKEVTHCSIPGGFYSIQQRQILKDLVYKKVFNSVPTYEKYNVDGMEILGRFSIEQKITVRQFNQILSYDILNQKRLFFRQKTSQIYHTFKHRINNS